MKKIIFVCTGNTCRSPMAMTIFNKYAAGLEPSEFGYRADSAGLSVFANDLPSANAVHAIKNMLDTDISGHRARMLTRSDVEEAFLVLTMSNGHKQHILSMFPYQDVYQKVFTLKEYICGQPKESAAAGGNFNQLDAGCGRPFSQDIADPYGGPLWVYEQCAREIAEAVKKVVEMLKKS